MILGVVLLIPCRGRFIHPFAVAGLGFRYFSINSSLMYGHPLRNPFLVARNSRDILGLHNDWCANFTLLARVVIECVNNAECASSASPLVAAVGTVLIALLLLMIGSVHRSVDASLYPRTMILPLYITSQ